MIRGRASTSVWNDRCMRTTAPGRAWLVTICVMASAELPRQSRVSMLQPQIE